MDQHLVSTISLFLFGFLVLRFAFLLFTTNSKEQNEDANRHNALAFANELYSAKKYRELEKFLSFEIKRSPKNVELRKILVNAYLKEDKIAKAAGQLENILRVCPKDAAAKGKLAECYTSLGKFKKAIMLAEEIHHADTKNPNALKNLAELYHSTGQTEAALNTYKAYLGVDEAAGENPEIQKIMAKLYAEDGEYENALSACDKLQKLKPDDVSILTTRLELAQKLRQWDRCLEVCLKIISLSGETKEMLEKIAQIYFNLKNWDEALKYYRKLADSQGENDANSLHYQNAVAEIYINQGNPKRAIEYLTDLITKHPQVEFLAFTLAQAYVELNDYEKAVGLYENLIESLPLDQMNIMKKHTSSLITRWAESLFELGDYGKAFDKFIQAMKYDENNPEVCYKFGVSNLKIKSINDAIGHFKRAITMDPKESRYYYALGCANEEFGNLKAAQNAFEDALSLEPSSTKYMTALGVVLSKQFINIEKGIELFNDITKVKPNDPDALYNLALAYDMLENKESATEFYKKTLELLPSHEEAKHNLSLLLGYEYNATEAGAV